MSSTRPAANRLAVAGPRSPGSGSTLDGTPSTAPWSIHACCSCITCPSSCWRSMARLMSSSAWNRSETSVRGSARAPWDDAWAARWVSRSSGTGHEVNRRRSVQRLSMASSSSGRVAGRGGRAPGRGGPAGPAGRGRGSRVTWRTSPSASAATCAWCSAAPQLITRLRPSGSPAASCAGPVGVQLERAGARHASAMAGCCARSELAWRARRSGAGSAVGPGARSLLPS